MSSSRNTPKIFQFSYEFALVKIMQTDSFQPHSRLYEVFDYFQLEVFNVTILVENGKRQLQALYSVYMKQLGRMLEPPLITRNSTKGKMSYPSGSCLCAYSPIRLIRHVKINRKQRMLRGPCLGHFIFCLIRL